MYSKKRSYTKTLSKTVSWVFDCAFETISWAFSGSKCFRRLDPITILTTPTWWVSLERQIWQSSQLLKKCYLPLLKPRTVSYYICHHLQGVTYDHVELNLYLNGKNMNCPASGIRGTVFPVVYGEPSCCGNSHLSFHDEHCIHRVLGDFISFFIHTLNHETLQY